MSIEQKVKAACDLAEISVTQLAERLGTSQQNMSKRLKTGRFTDEELKSIGEAIGAEYRSGFYFSNGNKVE